MKSLYVLICGAWMCVLLSQAEGGTTTSEKPFVPGTNRSFRWIDLPSGVKLMQEAKLGGVFYYYDFADKLSAKRWEERTFKDTAERETKAMSESDRKVDKSETLGANLVFVMTEIKEKRPQELENFLPRRGTGVLITDYMGKRIWHSTNPPSGQEFYKILQDAIRKNALAVRQMELLEARKKHEEELKRKREEEAKTKEEKAHESDKGKKSKPEAEKEKSDAKEQGENDRKQRQLVKSGRMLYLARCGECHNRPEINAQKLSEEQWVKLFTEMGVGKSVCKGLKLSEQEVAQLTAYVKQELAQSAEKVDKPDGEKPKGEKSKTSSPSKEQETGEGF